MWCWRNVAPIRPCPVPVAMAPAMRAAPSATLAPATIFCFVMSFVTPSDPETLLMGRLNAVYKREDKPVEREAAAAVGGFIVQ